MAVKSNTLKSTKKKTPTATRRKKKGKKQPSKAPVVIGLIFVLLGIYLLIACFSYLFTWKVDQSAVMEFSWGLLKESDQVIQNHLGRFGAILSHNLIYKGFGIAAFLFPLILLAQGINMTMKSRILPTMKWSKYGLLALLWIPPVMSLIFSGAPFAWGGRFGNAIAWRDPANLNNGWLIDFLSPIGTALLLVFLFIAFSIVVWNWDFNKLKLPKRKPKIDEEGFDIIDDEKMELINQKQYDHINTLKEENTDETATTELSVEPSSESPSETTQSEFEDVSNKKTINEFHSDLSLEVSTDADTPAAIEEIEATEEKAKGSIGTSYDPTLDLQDYKFPKVDLLDEHGEGKVEVDTAELERNKDQIVETLNNYKIEISKIKATVGPTVTLYEIVPAPGVRISKIKNLEDDIALSLAALGIRIIAPIPGKGTIGIEVPNQHKEIVSMHSMVASNKFQNSGADLPIVLGKTIANEIYMADLAKMPHLLIAGATGQGKSVGLNAILVSLLYKKHPAELKFVLVDPKKVELTIFKAIEKHYLAKLPGEEDPIITDTRKVVKSINALCMEMDDRYNLLKDGLVRNIKEYNAKFTKRKLNPEKGHRFLPYIVLVVDEFADLIMTAGKEIETPVARLAQLARAVGIHLVIATQRPSVNIITGTIKANFPARIAFRVTSKIDSRTILDMGGAEQLIGRGDMLLSIGGDSIRLQCPFVDTPEVDAITEFIGTQRGYPEAFELPEFLDEEEKAARGHFDYSDLDALFEDAARVIVQNQVGSTSMIQRRLKLGYNRAGRLMDQLEACGIVGPNVGSKAREVYIHTEAELEQFLTSLKERI